MNNPHSRTTLAPIVITVCLVLTSDVFAVSPPPDGGYANQNTAEGQDALFGLTDVGFYNTALGFHALYTTTGGYYNTATGNNALFSLANGDKDTATGSNALYSNTTGTGNTAMGCDALFNNRTGKATRLLVQRPFPPTSRGMRIPPAGCRPFTLTQAALATWLMVLMPFTATRPVAIT